MLTRIFGPAGRISLLAVWASGAMMSFVAFMMTFDTLVPPSRQ